jgi:DNA end-binding protein Ku
MARSLVASLSDRFKPEDYEDDYRAALEELIERKMRGEKRNAKRRKPEPKVIDLMDALKASVAASQTAEKRRPKPRKRATRSRRTKRAAAA